MFIKGAIPFSRVQQTVAMLEKDKKLGAYTIFMGQIRADELEGRTVVGINYSAYLEMAQKVLLQIKEEAQKQFDIRQISILHSLGFVKVGEASLMIIVGAAHRKACLTAQEFTIEKIKKELPVFGKEIFADGEFVWKENK